MSPASLMNGYIAISAAEEVVDMRGGGGGGWADPDLFP